MFCENLSTFFDCGEMVEFKDIQVKFLLFLRLRHKQQFHLQSFSHFINWSFEDG